MENNFDNKTYYEFETGREKTAVAVASTQSVSANSEPAGKYSTVAMILGIISLGLIFMGVGIFIPPVLQILSIVFAVKSRKYTETKKMNGKAIAGLVCGIVSLSLLLLIWMIMIIVIISIIPILIMEEFDAILEENSIRVFVRSLNLFIR